MTARRLRANIGRTLVGEVLEIGPGTTPFPIAPSARVTYVDWRDPSRNDWLAANQVWVTGDLYTRRVDLVLFVNGIPLVS